MMCRVRVALVAWTAAVIPGVAGSAVGGGNIETPKLPKVPEPPKLPGLSKLPDLRAPVDVSKDDISVGGACKAAVGRYCPDTTEGDGAVAHCVREALRAAKARKEEDPVTPECMQEVRAFFFKVMKHELPKEGVQGLMNRFRGGHNTFWVDPIRGFRKACEKDVQELCPGKRGPGAISCLKESKQKLSEQCRSKVFRVQEMQAEDMTLDKELFEACEEDLKGSECGSAPPGKRRACLSSHKHRDHLSEKCRAALFTKDKEESEDIRLDKELFSTCAGAIKTVCKDAEFGQAKMLRCLWENVASKKKMRDDGEHRECAQKVRTAIGHQVSDYRLDFRVVTRCASDIDKHCAMEKDLVDKMPMKDLFRPDNMGQNGKVLHCLKEKIEELEGDCSEEMRRVAGIHSMNAQHDPHLQRSCREDLKRFCPDTPAAQQHLCLRRHIKELSLECRQAELAQGRAEGGQLHMKPLVVQVCEEARLQFCKDSGGLHCLRDHMHDDGFPVECRKALLEDLEASNHDWQLKYGISTECQDDVYNTCHTELHGPAGSVLRCLSRALANDKIAKPGCKQEVARYAKQGANDIRVLPASFEACKSDLEQFCSSVPPGQGRLHACLLRNVHSLSAECRAAEFENQAHQVKSLAASPEGQHACGAVAEKVCPGVQDGTMRWACLMSKRQSPEMTTECLEVLRNHARVKQSEFFLNPSLVKSCEADARALCPDVFDAASAKDFSSRGKLIACLIEKRDQITSPECKAGVHRKQVERAADASLDPTHEDQCAGDIERFCKLEKVAAGRASGAGQVHKCLQRHVSELSPGCAEKEKQVMQMASEDTRLNFPIKEACGEARERWCKDLPDGEGKVTLCLLKHMHETSMDPACRKALGAEQSKRATSLRFNPVLRKTCAGELKRLQEAGRCGVKKSIVSAVLSGMNIDCLTDNKDDIQDVDCRTQVFHVLQMQSADLRAKPRMHDACKEDLEALCPGVQPGMARGHECLREKIEQVQNSECKRMVLQVQRRDNASASLNFRVRRFCANEKKMFCDDVEPGSSRLLVCLVSQSNATAFSEECKAALKKIDVKELMPKINKYRSGSVEKKMEELKRFIEAHRGFAEENAAILLGGTVGFVALLTAWLSWCLLRGCFSGKSGYTVVVPKDMSV